MKKYWLAILLIVGIGFWVARGREIKKDPQVVKPKNVILIGMDGLQAKHLAAYGYDKQLTPNLDKFLAESYLFTNTVSPSSWTVPTHMSIFTGMYPSEHKVVNKFAEYDMETKKGKIAKLQELTPEAITLAEVFKKAGYATGGFTGDAGVGPQFGFGAGFDKYFETSSFGGFTGSVPEALSWLNENQEKSFFLFVHGYDVHGQHAPAQGFDYRYVEKPYKGKYTGSIVEQGKLREEGLAKGKLALTDKDVNFWRAIYDEKINRMDEEFGKLMGEIEKRGLKENSIIVVFSDHGTEFFEHERVDHGHTLYGELVDVLLAFHIPGQKEGKRIEELVSTLDLSPTVLKLAGLEHPRPAQVKGVDLTPSFTGGKVAHDVYSETDYRLFTHKRAVTSAEGWKLILDMNSRDKELYKLSEDPNELTNLVEEEPRIAYELEQQLLGHLKEMGAMDGPWVLGCTPVYGNQCL